MADFTETSNTLRRWRIKLFRYVNIAKVILCAEVINCEPFDLRYALIIRQFDRKFFIEVSFQNVGSKNI